MEAVLMDRPSAEIPFQARAIEDQAMFASFGTRAAEPHAAHVDQPVRALPAGAGSICKIETQRRGRRPAAEQSRPGSEVGKIEEGAVGGKSDLLAHNGGIGGAGAAGHNRSDVAENRGAQIVGELVEVLMGDGERKPVLARF